jgi:hypothetical protein
MLLSVTLKKWINPYTRVFKHYHFQQWAKSESLTDKELKKAVDELESGLHDGNLGGGLYKKRVPEPGQGKRGSYRTLLAFRKGGQAFFVYGYAKNVKTNINAKEKAVYKNLAKLLLNLDEKTLENMIKIGNLTEVK